MVANEIPSLVTHSNFPLSTRVAPFGLSSHPDHHELVTEKSLAPLSFFLNLVSI